MDWTTAIVVGCFVLTCLASVYQLQKDGWGLHQTLGTALVLVGAAIALFLDDVLPGDSLLLPWAEPIGAVLLLVGLAVSRIWQPANADPDSSV